MLTAMWESMDGQYGRWTTVHAIDSENLCRAQEIFENYKKCGVILSDSFDDSVWRLSNQAKRVSLKLTSFEGNYRKNTKDWIGCSYRCYWDCAKAYIVFSLGEFGLSGLAVATRAFFKLAEISIDEVTDDESIKHVMGLLQIIPGGNKKRDYVMETLEEKLEIHRQRKNERSQRQLADFKTYLKFNEILHSFWKTADDRQKLFYFPLYFWWNLTAILPLRPMEFLLTPRECLKTGHKGENILTVRRTRLKGGFEKITYRIDKDYERKQYVINETLAAELRWYLTATENATHPEIGTLLSCDPHCAHIWKGKKPNIRYYSSTQLNTCINYFYQEVVVEHAVNVERILPGDTRHIAMANLIISGGSPVICRELAGHSDINVSSHYYSNISNLVECATLERYWKLKGEDARIAGTHKYALTLTEAHHRVLGGWCDVPQVQTGDVSECLKVYDGNGHIGNCVHCIHYWPDEQGIRLNFLDIRTGKDTVDADCHYLMQMIETVRKGLGHTEDVGTALLRLQRSCDHYSKCLWEQYMEAGDSVWQDQES